MEVLGRYMNGNVFTTILSDGTLIRETKDDEFHPAFASNMDIKICNRCDRGCPWCFEDSVPDGKLGDIMNEKFIDTLHPYQECSLGGGNVLEHPDLISFLYKLKNKKVIPNITLNQKHFENNIDLVEKLVSEKLVYGLGISLEYPTTEFIKKVKRFPNAVIHVINGTVYPTAIIKMLNKDLKILILGYKNLRRGSQFLDKWQDHIAKNQDWLKEELPGLIGKFKVVSFDNLAIEQLGIKERWSEFSDKPWDEFYAGDDGTNTYYIDMVERKFAKNSTADFDKRYDLLDNVDDMFEVIRNERDDIKEFAEKLIDAILDNAESKNIGWDWGEETLRVDYIINLINKLAKTKYKQPYATNLKCHFCKNYFYRKEKRKHREGCYGKPDGCESYEEV